MKLSFLKFKTNSYLKRNKAIRINLPYKQALTVGIIFTADDKTKHDEIKEFIKNLERDGKKVNVISFLPKNKENFEFLFDFFTEKDLSFWGNILSDAANRFTNTPFDFLYYVDATPNPLTLNLIAKSKAKCRVGRHWENAEAFFEMMIESKNGIKSLIETMYKYTRSIQ